MDYPAIGDLQPKSHRTIPDSCLSSKGRWSDDAAGPAGNLQDPRHDVGRQTMKTWRKPKFVEISVGTEINAYACADL